MSGDKLRVYYMWKKDDEPIYNEVDSLEGAVYKLRELTECASSGCEVMCNNGDWIEYYDGSGRDIKEIMENEGSSW